MASSETSDGTRTTERWTNEGTAGYYGGNPLTWQRELTAAEVADLDAMDAGNARTGNLETIEAKATAALTANEQDLTQDATIRTQALALAATTGNRTTAQLSNDVRALAQGVAVLAQNDTNSKRELNALIRLMLGLLDSTDGT